METGVTMCSLRGQLMDCLLSSVSQVEQSPPQQSPPLINSGLGTIDTTMDTLLLLFKSGALSIDPLPNLQEVVYTV